jgi:hypothetical protein
MNDYIQGYGEEPWVVRTFLKMAPHASLIIVDRVE